MFGLTTATRGARTAALTLAVAAAGFAAAPAAHAATKPPKTPHVTGAPSFSCTADSMTVNVTLSAKPTAASNVIVRLDRGDGNQPYKKVSQALVPASCHSADARVRPHPRDQPPTYSWQITAKLGSSSFSVTVDDTECDPAAEASEAGMVPLIPLGMAGAAGVGYVIRRRRNSADARA